MAPLDRVRIRGFKSIRELDLELRPLNVLIGANGSGKSNFIDFFTLLREIVNLRLQAYVARSGGASSLLHFGPKVTPEMRLRVHFGRNVYDARLEAAEDDTLFFAEETCWYHGPGYPKPYTVELGSGHRESGLIEESQRHDRVVIADHVINSILSWQVYQFHDTSDSARVKQTGDLGDNAFLRPDAANLAAFLFMLRETQRPYYDRIVKTIRLVAPFFDDFTLRPSPLNPDKIRLEWRERGSDAYFTASALSDGTLRFMCLATLLLQPELPATVLIDEPELGLHPYAITLLTSLLRGAAEKTQVIAATQSVPLVNQFVPDEVLVVDRIDGQSTFQRLSEAAIEGWLENYGLGDLWEKNVIGGRPQP